MSSPLLVLSFCLLAVAIAAPNDPYATGPTCGDTGRSCLSPDARCRSGQCQCKQALGYSWGDGHFSCYADDTIACEIKNDPKLTTYDGDSEDFPFPCRYLASHIKPKLLDKHGREIGYCVAKVYAFNARSKGKLFVHGFDVSLRIVYDSGEVIRSSFRHYGKAATNTNSVSKHGKDGMFDYYDPETGDDISYNKANKGVKVSFTWDRQDNKFTYTAKGCGIKIFHVPYDTELGLEQRQVPGLSVAVSRANEPEWLSKGAAMCLVPKEDGGKNLADIKLDNFNKARSLLLRAFQAGVIQTFPGENVAQNQCAKVADTLSDCQEAKAKQSMRKCDWILTNRHFKKCYDNALGNGKYINLFNRCVQSWCNNTPCATAISKVQESGCDSIGGVPELAGFVNGDRCPSASRPPQ